MTIVELFVIAVGLSMDAFAVSICKGLSVKKLRSRHAFSTAMWFGGFQALMPLIGYFVGIHFADFVASVDHWISFILLAIIGGNMIKESREAVDTCEHDPDFSFKKMLALAIATSIDALLIGVTMSVSLTINVVIACLVIALITFLLVAICLVLGKKLGDVLGKYAEWTGAIILLLLAIKNLVTAIM